MTRTLPDVPGLRAQGPDVHRRLLELADRQHLNVDRLAALIAHESGWNPRARNHLTQAVGLIQFMPRYTRRIFGVTADQIERMSTLEQLDLVEKFFATVAKSTGPIGDDVAIAAFLPSYVHKPDGTIAFERGTKGYSQNAPLDRDMDGRITLGEVRRDVLRMLVGRGRFEVPSGVTEETGVKEESGPKETPTAPTAKNGRARGSGAALVLLLLGLAVPLLARGFA